MTYNINQVSTMILADQFAHLGISDVVIGAGSRSTPLTLSFTTHGAFNCYSMVDERSAAYFALGLSLVTKKPTILVCTSGTALANFFPAIIEAYYSSIPLIVISADRPHELRETGANQTIDQVKVYGKHVLWFQDLPVPNSLSETNIQNLKNTVTKSVFFSTAGRRGPVHLNYPFRKPLEPETSENLATMEDIRSVYGEIVDFYPSTAGSVPNLSQVDHSWIQNVWKNSRRVMVIAGPKTSETIDPNVLYNFVSKSGCLLLADGLSDVRYKSELEGSEVTIISCYETFLQIPNLVLDEPDLILHLGQFSTSKYLETYLKSGIQSTRIQITPFPIWEDSTLNSNHFIQCDPSTLLEFLIDLDDPKETDWKKSWIDTDIKTIEMTKEYLVQNPEFEPSSIYQLFQIDQEFGAFFANSLPVRHLDQFVSTQHSPSRKIYSNRGASGIDGNVSTALGISKANNLPMVLVIGDLAFYHDMNGLLASMRYNIPLKIILLNNRGGGIFQRLPVTKFDPQFTEFFLTPHELNFELVAKLYDFHYLVTESSPTDAQLQELFAYNRVILEIKTDSAEIEQHRKQLLNKTEETLLGEN